MKTILHVIDTTGPGGAETVFIDLVKLSILQGWDTIAVVRAEGWLKQQLDKTGADVLVIDCKGSFNIKYLWSLIGLVRKRKVDLIQSHLLGASVYCSLIGILRSVPVVCTFHGGVDISRGERLKRLKFQLIKLGANKVVAVTEALKVIVEGQSPLKAVEVVYNGVDLDTYSKKDIKKSEYFSPPIQAKYIVGALGNIRVAKNYKLAVDVIVTLRSRGVDIVLTIAGDDRGPLASELRDYIKINRMEDGVYLIGFIDSVASYLSTIDAYLLTSTSEGHPLAITQAMSVGVPIVATTCGVEEVLVDGAEALLAPVGDVEKICDSLLTVLERADVRASLIENAKKSVREKYSLSAMQDAYLKIYREVTL